MIFSIIIILLIGLAAYYHYLQGLFSSALSLGIALIATVVAFGYHEAVVDLVNQGFFNAQASAVVLCCLFAATYIILRAIFDKVVPGNVRYPVLAEKIGAPALGAIVGILAAGILAVAAQTLPFGPTLGMYGRFDMEYDKPVAIRHVKKSGQPQSSDAVYDALRDPQKFRNNESPNRLLLPADDLVLSFIEHVSSANGSLSNGVPWASIHPDFLQQAFGQRIGIQQGSKHAALRKPPSGQPAHLLAAFLVGEKEALRQRDPERQVSGNPADRAYVGVRGTLVEEEKKDPTKRLPRDRRAEAGKVMLIARVQVSRDDSDDVTNVVAFGPANVRLVLPDTTSGTAAAPVTRWYNEFPIGTMERDELFLAEPDDYHFVAPDQAVDLVFEVKREDLLLPETTEAKAPRIRDGIFLEFKRFPRIPLAQVELKKTRELLSADAGAKSLGILRKKDPMGGAIDSTDTAADLKAPLKVESVGSTLNARLPFSVGFGSDQNVQKTGTARWGSYEINEGKFRTLVMDPMDSEDLVGKGQHTYNALSFIQDGQVFEARFRVISNDKRAWLDDLNEFRLVDGAQKHHDAVGMVARLQNNQSVNYPLVRFQTRKAIESPPKELTPTDVTLYFVVPYGTEIKAVSFKKQTLANVQAR